MFAFPKCSVMVFPLVIFWSASSTSLVGQSNSDLLPPVSFGGINMACVEAAADGQIKIIKSKSQFVVEPIESASDKSKESSADNDAKESTDEKANDEEAKADDRPVTEMVAQTYTVMIPYTEQITKDGREITVTKTRAETRTRMVPVTRRGGTIGTGGRTVSYQVQVPYMEEVQDAEGNIVVATRFRTETRVIDVGEGERLVEKLTPLEATVDPAQLKFYTLHGKSILSEEMVARIGERAPVILLSKDEPLGEYYQELFHADTILIFDKANIIQHKLMDAQFKKPVND